MKSWLNFSSSYTWSQLSPGQLLSRFLRTQIHSLVHTGRRFIIYLLLPFFQKITTTNFLSILVTQPPALIRNAIWTACCSSYTHSSEHSYQRHQTFQKVLVNDPSPNSTGNQLSQHSASVFSIWRQSGLNSPAVPAIPRETCTELRCSKHPPLKLVLIEHSVFPPTTRNPKTLTASSQLFFSWTPHSICPRLQQN